VRIAEPLRPRVAARFSPPRLAGGLSPASRTAGYTESTDLRVPCSLFLRCASLCRILESFVALITRSSSVRISPPRRISGLDTIGHEPPPLSRFLFFAHLGTESSPTAPRTAHCPRPQRACTLRGRETIAVPEKVAGEVSSVPVPLQVDSIATPLEGFLPKQTDCVHYLTLGTRAELR
jgi:hypothetical protein